MFVPGDPRFDELLRLANHATGRGLLDAERARFRELVTQLLGNLRAASEGSIPERRQHLRAEARLEVDILSPQEIAGVLSSDVSAGGLGLALPIDLPQGTPVDLSVRIAGRDQPLRARAMVAFSKGGRTGVAFIDLFQNDRELLEAIAVKSLLARSALE